MSTPLHSLCAAIVLTMVPACAGKTDLPVGAPDAAASDSDGVEASIDSAVELPNPKILMAVQNNSICASWAIVTLETKRGYKSLVPVCEDHPRLDATDLSPTQVDLVSSAIAKLPAGGSDCSSARNNMAHVVSFELTRKNGSSEFWWGCQDDSGALLEPYAGAERAIRAAIPE